MRFTLYRCFFKLPPKRHHIFSQWMIVAIFIILMAFDFGNIMTIINIILTLIYIDRICELHKINLNYNNIHKLILASFATANKYLEDIHYSMHFFSKVVKKYYKD